MHTWCEDRNASYEQLGTTFFFPLEPNNSKAFTSVSLCYFPVTLSDFLVSSVPFPRFSLGAPNIWYPESSPVLQEECGWLDLQLCRCCENDLAKGMQPWFSASVTGQHSSLNIPLRIESPSVLPVRPWPHCHLPDSNSLFWNNLLVMSYHKDLQLILSKHEMWVTVLILPL